MSRRIKRAANWSPLSDEARALFDRDPGAWDYVELWDGAAAQACAFGVGNRPPDLFTISHGVEPPASSPDRSQGDLFGPSH